MWANFRVEIVQFWGKKPIWRNQYLSSWALVSSHCSSVPGTHISPLAAACPPWLLQYYWGWKATAFPQNLLSCVLKLDVVSAHGYFLIKQLPTLLIPQTLHPKGVSHGSIHCQFIHSCREYDPAIIPWIREGIEKALPSRVAWWAPDIAQHHQVAPLTERPIEKVIQLLCSPTS